MSKPEDDGQLQKVIHWLIKDRPSDAFVIADFARAGRIECEPWRGSQYLALKRLTRHRLHLAGCISREKTYMVSNLYLKFSELQLLQDDDRPFSNLYGAASSAVLTEFMSVQDIIDAPEEELLSFWLKRAGTGSRTCQRHRLY